MWCEIRVGGHLDARRSVWLAGLAIATTDGGESVLTGAVADQAALYGLLSRLRDLNVPLRLVVCWEGDRPPAADTVVIAAPEAAMGAPDGRGGGAGRTLVGGRDGDADARGDETAEPLLSATSAGTAEPGPHTRKDGRWTAHDSTTWRSW